MFQEKKISFTKSCHHINKLSLVSTFTASRESDNDQPEVVPAGPDTDQGGRQINWPGIQAAHGQQSHSRSRSQVKTKYSSRGSDGSRPGHPEDFAVREDFELM